MGDSPKLTLRVDRYALADIASSRPILDALLQVGSSFSGVREPELLLDRLLEQIFTWVPAERGAVLLTRRNTKDIQTAAARGSGLDVNVELVAKVLAGREAILVESPQSILCAPLRVFDSDLGAIYLHSRTAAVFDIKHLHLLVAVASVAALALNNARYVALLEGENQRLRDYAYIDQGFVGNSPAIREVHNFIGKMSGSESTVLILGESGTGKELVARGIHRNGRRSDGPFVAINCAAIVDTLIESELFGHERGAFSGAIAQKKGKVEAADGGTLFLDEVGELSLQTQAALLRFLQEREFQRVGGTKTLRADVRIVAATNRNLEERIGEGKFRSDLYYRLQVVEIRTPSLAQIPEDIPLLVEHFLKRFRYIRVVSGISPEAMKILVRYPWPGNARQLANAIEHALGIGRSEWIEPEDLPSSVTGGRKPSASVAKNLDVSVDELKRTLITRALAEADGNFDVAAARLDLSSSYLRRLARSLDVKWP